MMLQVIECRGSPYEIGRSHGTSAKTQITRSIAFYAQLFQQSSQKSWDEVRELAGGFEGRIREAWPKYWEEMRGVADGSSHDLLDIIALNVRTEITFGLFSASPSAQAPMTASPIPPATALDGCTSLSLKTPTHSYLGQNWDWMTAQKQNLIILHISPLAPLPALKIVTEAGIIGKIGLNALGVGVCFNAIRARGMDASRLPVHLGLRRVLECGSAREAVKALEEVGMASSAHMLIADADGGVGLEFSATTLATLEPDAAGKVYHSNHLLARHNGVEEPPWLGDSCARVERIKVLAADMGKAGGEVGWEEFGKIFEDQEGAPGSICRKQVPPETTSETLFNIVMDLVGGKPRAVVKLGRPCEVEEVVEFGF